MNLKTKKILFSFALILMFSAGAIFSVSPNATAQTPSPINIPTYAYLSVAPNPTGVNQAVSIIMWLDKFPPTANGQYGDRWHNFTVEVTTPDGSKQTLGPFANSDPVGTFFTQYTPDKLGTYSFIFKFPGQVLAGENPPPEGFNFGNTLGGFLYIGDYYEPSQSDPVTITVQQTPIAPWNAAPLPTGYWARPINGQNREWQAVASNWMGNEPNAWQQYGQAPNSGHIVWTKPIAFGGLVDGRFGDISFYDGLSYEGFFGPPIIINGVLYYNTAIPPEYGFTAVNLRTGEQMWYQNNTIGPQQLVPPFLKQSFPQLTFGQLLLYNSPNQFGILPYLWSTFTEPTSDPAVSLNDWAMYDAFSGNWICTIRGVPTSSAFFGASTQVTDSNGNILIYDMSTPGKIALWNSTACLQNTFPSNNAQLAANGYWLWRPPLGATVSASSGYVANVSLPAELPAGASVQGVDPVNQIMLFAAGLPILGIAAYPTPATFTMSAVSLKTGQLGQLLWQKSYPWPTGNQTFAVSAVGSGAFALYYKETRQWVCYNLTTGNQMWGPTASQNEWDVYALSWTPSVIADNCLLSASYGGYLYAYDLQTGNLKWTPYFSGTGPDNELPYGHYPLSIGGVADGKVFLYNSEHSPNKPYWRGSSLRAVSITTGQELWSVNDWAGVAGFSGGVAIADGYLVTINSYDNQIYCYGKGQTATEVSASPTIINNGGKVLIQGKITDQSPAAKNNPAVVPDEFIDDWMNYLVEQQALPALPGGNIGVPVILTAAKADGSSINLGTISADCEGNFKSVWSPPDNGEYTITAYFPGTKSYFSSYASTSVATVASGGVTPGPTSAPAAKTDNTLLYVIIVIVIIAIIIGLANMIAINRHQHKT